MIIFIQKLPAKKHTSNVFAAQTKQRDLKHGAELCPTSWGHMLIEINYKIITY